MRRIPEFFRRAEPEREAQVTIPPARMAQVLSVLRRRVSDTVEDAFGRACLAGDAAPARDLLIVVERMALRGEHFSGGERRRITGQVQRLRTELARCAALGEGEPEVLTG